MIGIHPRTMLDDITECARVEIYNTVEAISGWATRIADGKGEEAEREVDIVRRLRMVKLMHSGSACARDTA